MTNLKIHYSETYIGLSVRITSCDIYIVFVIEDVLFKHDDHVQTYGFYVLYIYISRSFWKISQNNIVIFKQRFCSCDT